MTDDKANEWKLWAMGIHLSVLLSYLVPIAGLVVPIVLWQTKKQQMPELDAHGKEVVNFLISFGIYAVVAVVLCLALVGFFILIPLGVAAVAFPIIGGIKANDGVLWHYPLTIRFFK